MLLRDKTLITLIEKSLYKMYVYALHTLLALQIHSTSEGINAIAKKVHSHPSGVHYMANLEVQTKPQTMNKYVHMYTCCR